MFVEAIQKILQSIVTPAYVREVETGAAPTKVWRALEEAGFLDVLVPEEHGGAGLPLPDFHDICHLLGAYAVPAPVAETMVARRLIAGTRDELPGPITLASSSAWHTDATLRCASVPFGTVAKTVLAVHDAGSLMLPVENGLVTPSGVWGSQTASFEWAPAALPQPQGNAEDIRAFAATSYAAMLCGAMERVFRLTVQYCNDRVQFGKPLGKFQAVQHQLAVMAEHLVAASLAAQAAFRGGTSAPPLLAAAIAKARASEAALLVANTSHALHGAIGITEEYDLQRYSRRLHEWRMAHGSEAFWNNWVGAQVLSSDVAFCDFVRAA